jgi:hypothetical protein
MNQTQRVGRRATAIENSQFYVKFMPIAAESVM